MKRLAIVGTGLMGGALGLAVRKRGLPWRVSASARRAETRDLALRLGAADEVFAEPADAVRDADLVVFCLPVLAISDALRACRANWKEGAVITDVASTKTELVEAATEIVRDTAATFVGSHPIAGSEQTGLEAARADLYEGAVVVVTPRPDSPAEAVGRVQDFWKDFGARVTTMTPEEHDRLIARTSHLPHLVAAMLVESICAEEGDRAALLCGGGFRDSTRIAAGSPEIWHDIVKTNRVAIGRALEDFDRALRRMRERIRDGDFESLRRSLDEARRHRQAFGERMKKGRAAP